MCENPADTNTDGRSADNWRPPAPLSAAAVDTLIEARGVAVAALTPEHSAWLRGFARDIQLAHGIGAP